MDVKKVAAWLIDEMADPLSSEVARTILQRIRTEKSPVGKLLRRLLAAAEAGEFR